MQKQICIKADALAIPGEDGKPVSPEVGDSVDFSATGKVTRVEGDNVYLDMETVNGKPVEEIKEAEPAKDMDEAGMEAAMASADENEPLY